MPQYGDRMQMAGARPTTGKGYIKAFGFGPGFGDKLVQPAFCGFDLFTNFFLQHLNVLAEFAAFFCRDFADKLFSFGHC